jgi:hypothetical protein
MLPFSGYHFCMIGAYWQQELEEPGRELKAATQLSEVRAAVGKLQREAY